MTDSFRTAELAGTRFRYELAGSGEPVVLLHGGLLDLRQWDDLLPVLAGSFRVLRYDARGFGGTPLGRQPYAHYTDLRLLLDHLGLERVHLVSLSAGTAAAVDFALEWPERVRSLAIGAAPMRGYDVGDEFVAGMRGIFDAALAGDRALHRERVWSFAPMRVARDLPDARARLDRMIVEDHAYGYARPEAPERRFREPPSATVLGELVAPTLVVVGDGEMPALAAAGRFFAESIPGARHVVIQGAGHFVNLEQPAAYAEVIAGWLAENAGS